MTDRASLDNLIVGGVSEWVEALPSYQRSHIERLLATQDPIEVATLWLSASGPADTAPFGGVRAGAARFYDNLLLELQKLFCGGEGYEEDRKQLGQAANAGKLVIVGSISTLIAPHVGAAAAVLGPAIAITLGVVGNAGKASICDALAEVIANRAVVGESDQPGEA